MYPPQNQTLAEEATESWGGGHLEKFFYCKIEFVWTV